MVVIHVQRPAGILAVTADRARAALLAEDRHVFIVAQPVFAFAFPSHHLRAFTPWRFGAVSFAVAVGPAASAGCYPGALGFGASGHVADRVAGPFSFLLPGGVAVFLAEFRAAAGQFGVAASGDLADSGRCAAGLAFEVAAGEDRPAGDAPPFDGLAGGTFQCLAAELLTAGAADTDYRGHVGPFIQVRPCPGPVTAGAGVLSCQHIRSWRHPPEAPDG